MNKRYAFCNFSNISGYPHPVPSKDEWENSLPRFRGEEWEVPAEYLLDFHDFIHRLEIVHEDVQINLFRYSLEGIALDWCRSLPNASISSLADFHAAFHLFCKGKFSADLLYPECCQEFSLLNKELNIYEEFVAVEDTSFYDQEIGDLQNDKLSVDAFDIVPNAFTVLGCHEDQIIHFGNSKDNQQIDISADDSFKSAANTKDSLQLSDWQTKGNHNRYGEKDDEQIFSACDSSGSAAKVELSTFNTEISESSQQHQQHQQHFSSQLDQQQVEVFLCGFDDPIADYLDSIRT
jgi:hypothetical protein